ncbi:hypothetical protein SAMN05443572_11088 [Myxococcus fulvus]|uniref:Lipoprotein n=1 Tax=Myxococcus fulvus TaxID=33 RepID=A0A511T801_MYXFU|nr:hypothetical protein MFU01_53470 [Myxococcus fulvus]SEU34606.1 hypothetical protein SAMN05443572_11088 [Myxococcus fulvus]
MLRSTFWGVVAAVCLFLGCGGSQGEGPPEATPLESTSEAQVASASVDAVCTEYPSCRSIHGEACMPGERNRICCLDPDTLPIPCVCLQRRWDCRAAALQSPEPPGP